ncbi:hypothetical protein T492DRAFT_889418 [Pavlovales sp. CCMP2436]|nr:hypothetical protein T492DRAFT_889418 [Pavlovales sp. CCMP2436]
MSLPHYRRRHRLPYAAVVLVPTAHVSTVHVPAAEPLARGRGGPHKRAHSGEREHACNEPGYEYWATTASHLTAHKRTHSGK